MKKTWKTLILAGILSLSLSIPVFAGSWQSDATGYWYQNDDGTYPINCWKWIDNNNDGIAESYYFNDKGYLLVSITTADGYTVDANGAWIIDGVVQTQTVAASSIPTQPQKQDTQVPVQTQQANSSTNQSTVSQVQTDSVWLPATGEKYHKINNCGKMNPNKARNISLDEAIQRGYTPCNTCY